MRCPFSISTAKLEKRNKRKADMTCTPGLALPILSVAAPCLLVIIPKSSSEIFLMAPPYPVSLLMPPPHPLSTSHPNPSPGHVFGPTPSICPTTASVSPTCTGLRAMTAGQHTHRVRGIQAEIHGSQPERDTWNGGVDADVVGSALDARLSAMEVRLFVPCVSDQRLAGTPWLSCTG